MRTCTWIALSFAFLFVGIVHGQIRFSIRAASEQPVEGWQQMRVEHSERTVWVAPTAAIVAGDIEKAQPEIRADGDRIIKIVFTDAGANKIRDLTTAQLNKFVAIVVDDKLIWAPRVNAAIGKASGLTGSGPQGLTQEEVERIMSILR